MYWFITTVPVAFYWHCSDETVGGHCWKGFQGQRLKVKVIIFNYHLHTVLLSIRTRQRTPSAVYKCVNATTADAYILTLWYQGSLDLHMPRNWHNPKQILYDCKACVSFLPTVLLDFDSFVRSSLCLLLSAVRVSLYTSNAILSASA